MAALASYRFLDYVLTGFYLTDEWTYFRDAVAGNVYAARWFFSLFNIFTFRVFHISTPDQWAYLLPVFIMFWTGLGLLIVYLTLRELDFSHGAIALTLGTSFFLVSGLLLSAGFLTETVGLPLAMGGIYFLVRYWKTKTTKGIFLFSILSVLSFIAASGTRQPYLIFLYFGVIAIGVTSWLKVKDRTFGRSRRGLHLLLAASLVYVLLCAIFIVFPHYTPIPYVVGLHPYYSAHTWTTTAQSTATATAQSTATATAQTTATATLRYTGAKALPTFSEGQIVSWFEIFGGGLALGWGPIGVGVALLGLFFAFKALVKKNDTRVALILTISIIAVGTFFATAFLFSHTKDYFSFKNFSSIIRYSDTALPAYFLLAPLALERVAKDKKKVAVLALAVLVFIGAAVPAYESYASSNLAYTGGNPFLLSYRSQAVQVRNYFTNTSGSNTYMVGFPVGWNFTFGVSNMRNLHVYGFVAGIGYPSINYSQFVSDHWSTFYLFDGNQTQQFSQSPKFVREFVFPATGGTYPYAVQSKDAVLSGNGWVLYKIQLTWTS